MLGVLIVLIPCICFCNSAEPPSLLIIVSNPPNDLEISLTGKDNTTISARVDDKGIEKYYTFYSRDFQQASEDVLIISRGATKVKVNILRPLDLYSNVQTLDLKTMTLTRGKLLSRSIILVAIRVILTLGIEGAIFFLMGFREMRSWIAFFIINLITQGLLNVWINSFSPVASYLIISLIIGEFMGIPL